MKTILFIFLYLLFTSIWANSPEEQIEKMIFNTIDGNRKIENIVAPDFDATITKLLGESYFSSRNTFSIVTSSGTSLIAMCFAVG